LKTTAENLKASIERLALKVADLSIAELEPFVDTLRIQVAALLEAAEPDVQVLNAKVEALEADVRTLTAKVQAAEADNVLLKSDIRTLTTKGQAADVDNVVLKADIRTLTADNVVLKADIRTLTADNVVLKADMRTLTAKVDAETQAKLAIARKLRLRGAADAIEELVIIRVSGLTQDQLRDTRLFRMGDIHARKRLAGRLAVRVTQAATTVPAAVKSAAAAAVRVGLDDGRAESVTADAAEMVADGRTDAEIETAVQHLIGQAVAELGSMAPDTAAHSAIMDISAAAFTAAYTQLIPREEHPLIIAGQKAAVRGGNHTALPAHELAAANLEEDAVLAFGDNAKELIAVQAVVRAFRRAFAAACVAQAKAGDGGGSGAGAMPVPIRA